MRLRLLHRLTLVFFALLIGALAYNQLIKGLYYFNLSQNNRIKLIRLEAARGSIYDRKGAVLAGTRLMFNLAILPQEAKDVQKALAKISPIVGIPEQGLLGQFKKNFLASFIPVVVARDIPKETAIILESKESDIGGLVIQTEPLRDYPYGEGLCHILGYLSKISEEELTRLKAYGLQAKDFIGKTGIEEKFDYLLRGQPGGMQVEVNNRGYKVRVLGKKRPQNGQDLYLTIEAQLQEFVNELMAQETGACIVMDPQNGEILSLVSKPGFDPNLFIAALNKKSQAGERLNRLLSSEQAPLLNRAISGLYPPGSIFKIAVAAAGLESGKISPRDAFDCPGSFHLGNHEFLCWKLDGHGWQNVYSGLAHSCNVFFYKLGLKLGIDRIGSFARKFGLGRRTGIDLPYEAKGLVPSRGWKLKTYRERWYDGETVNFSIGQGYLLATPVQIAQMVSAVANAGYLVRPHIVKSTDAQKTAFLRQQLNLKQESISIIKEGMRRVIQDEDGTGHRAKVSGIEWAGKTGTAQTSDGLPHGWFVGFYPLEQARISVLVFLEYGGSGGEAPALIAKRIMEYIRENEN